MAQKSSPGLAASSHSAKSPLFPQRLASKTANIELEQTRPHGGNANEHVFVHKTTRTGEVIPQNSQKVNNLAASGDLQPTPSKKIRKWIHLPQYQNT